MKSLISRLWSRLTGAARRLYELIAPGVKSEVLDYLNDPAVQEAARDACEMVQAMGLRDTEARFAARDAFRNLAGSLARRVATHVIDAAIAIALITVRNRLQPDG